MEREDLDQWCDRAMVFMTLAILVFAPLAIGGVRPTEFFIIEALVMGLLALWLVRLWLHPQARIFWPPACWAVLLFAGYALFLYERADIEYLARQELVRVLIYAIFFLALVNAPFRAESMQFIWLSVIFLAGAISLYAIYQFLTNSPYVWHFLKPPGYMKRGTGTYICPNHLAGFLEMLAPLALSYLLIGRLGQVTRAVTGYCVLMILAGIGVTVSRGGWIATGLGLVFFFLLLLGHREYRLPGLIALGFVLVAAIALLWHIDIAHQRLEVFLSGKSDDMRFLIWRPAIEIWRDHFWFGAGPGHFNERFRFYRPLDLQMQMSPQRAHNDYLNTLADWGVIGLGIIGVFVIFAAVGGVQSWRAIRPNRGLGGRGSNRLAFILGSAGGLVAILFHSVVDFNMHIPANALLAVALLAFLTAHLRAATDRWTFPPHWVTKTLVCLLGLATLGYLGQEGFHRAGATLYSLRAERSKSSVPEQIALLRRAHEEDPMNFETTYAIGELYRDLSWRGGDDYAALAREAMKWFMLGMRLNRYDPYNYVRYGMCLDWLDQHGAALPYFRKAVELDPLGYYVLAHMGWHYLELGDYATARTWFEKSFRSKWVDNPLAESYFRIIDRKLREAAQKPGTGENRGAK